MRDIMIVLYLKATTITPFAALVCPLIFISFVFHQFSVFFWHLKLSAEKKGSNKFPQHLVLKGIILHHSKMKNMENGQQK